MTTWRPISTAPRDGTKFIGLFGNLVFRAYFQDYYVKWPHEEGGPTYRKEVTYETTGAIVPSGRNFKGWQPLPPPPTTGE